MKAQLVFLRGSREGVTVVLSRPEATVGRHQDADLRLHPTRDTEVSARHAFLYRIEEKWFVRDLGSRNGTLVNGQAIQEDVELKDGDRVEFGSGGPLAEFHLLPRIALEEPQDAWAAPPPTQPFEVRMPPGDAAPGNSSLAAEPRSDGEPSGTTSHAGARQAGERTLDLHLRVEVRRETMRLRALIALLVLALVAVGGSAILAVRTQRAEWSREVAAMEARVDSILGVSAATSAALEDRLQGVREALATSQENLRRLRPQLASAEERGDAEGFEDLRRQLLEAQAALRRHELAAGMDFGTIERRNRPAIAKVFVESRTGDVFTATAFAVLPDGTLVTNRHVVTSAGGGGRPRRIAVQFANSDQVWPARILATASEDDLALLKLDNIRGSVPTVTGLNSRPDTVQGGSPVAVIGYPLGGGSAEGGAVARTTTTAGIVHSMQPALLRVRGYGAEGSSGSPILDGNGEVIAVLFGGEDTDGNRTLLAVPSGRVLAFLQAAVGTR